MAVSKGTNPHTPHANSPEEIPSEPDMLERPPDYAPRPGIINFTEAAGKTVAFIYINYVQAPEWQSLEVRFTDGTFFTFHLMPRVYVRVDYTESQRGDTETIRDYGIIQCNAREDGDG